MAGASRQKYSDIWTRFERSSVPSPLQPDSDEFDPDSPSSAIGKTRPTEHAVSKGVEKFDKTYQRSGMAGVSAELAGCYRWALQIAKPTGRRVALEHCAAMDIVAHYVDAAFTSKMNLPPTEYFEAAKLEARLNQIRDQRFEGMVFPVYRRNLETSTMVWLDFFVELEASKEGSSQGARVDVGGLLTQWHDLNGQCRGGSGDEQKTVNACERRERVGRQLSQAGYCYGQRGEYGYQMKWHSCGPNSIR